MLVSLQCSDVLRAILSRRRIFVAQIDPEELGPNQADPVSPDEVWPEAPAGWLPRQYNPQ